MIVTNSKMKTEISAPPPPAAPRHPMDPPQIVAGAGNADPNSGHRLLPDCVLHNVLAMLYVPDVVHVATAARGFRDTALRVPQINCCGEHPMKDGVSTLVRVLSRFKNRISAFHMGNMEGIPRRRGQEIQSDGAVVNTRKDVENCMAAVFKYLDNLHDLSMHNLRLDSLSFDGFLASMDRVNSDAIGNAGSEESSPGCLARLHRLDLRGALFPKPDSLRLNLCAKLNPLKLAELVLDGCRTLEDACLNFVLAQCKGLKTICIGGATRIRQPSLMHARLRCIDMSRCTNLVGFDCLDLPQAEELCLQWCRRFQDAAAAKLFASGSCPRLRHVDFDGCIALRKLVVAPSSPDRKLNLSEGSMPTLNSSLNLRFLRVGMCEELTSIKVLGCQHLQNLELTLCVGLQNLHVESASLRELSLALLPKVVQIKLRCPNLVSLDLTGTGVAVRDAQGALKHGGMGDMGRLSSNGSHVRRHKIASSAASEVPYVLELYGCNPSLLETKDEASRMREGDGPTATGLGYGMHSDVEESEDEETEPVVSAAGGATVGV